MSNNYIEYGSNINRNKTPSIEYLNKIRPHLKDIINVLKKSDTWKIQFTLVIDFISSKTSDEGSVMHSKSDKTEFMIHENADEVIEELFQPDFLSRYQIELETCMKGSKFIFDCVHLLY